MTEEFTVLTGSGGPMKSKDFLEGIRNMSYREKDEKVETLRDQCGILEKLIVGWWERDKKKLVEKYKPLLDNLDRELKNGLEQLSKVEIRIDKDQLVATNTHHFNENTTLVITGDKMKWRCGEKFLDPSDMEDFIRVIDVVFRFTGVCFDVCYSNTFTDYIEIKVGENREKLDTLSLIRWLYDQPLEQEIRMIQLSTCGCNMGYCGAVVGIDIDATEYKTYGDLMKLFGMSINLETDPNHTYYGYPDSVILCVRPITNLPSTMYDGSSCYSDSVPVTQILDPNITYISWEYSR